MTYNEESRSGLALTRRQVIIGAGLFSALALGVTQLPQSQAAESTPDSAELVYAIRWGGSSIDTGYSIFLAENGNVIVGSQVILPNNPSTPGQTPRLPVPPNFIGEISTVTPDGSRRTIQTPGVLGYLGVAASQHGLYGASSENEITLVSSVDSTVKTVVTDAKGLNSVAATNDRVMAVGYKFSDDSKVIGTVATSNSDLTEMVEYHLELDTEGMRLESVIPYKEGFAALGISQNSTFGEGGDTYIYYFDANGAVVSRQHVHESETNQYVVLANKLVVGDHDVLYISNTATPFDRSEPFTTVSIVDGENVRTITTADTSNIQLAYDKETKGLFSVSISNEGEMILQRRDPRNLQSLGGTVAIKPDTGYFVLSGVVVKNSVITMTGFITGDLSADQPSLGSTDAFVVAARFPAQTQDTRIFLPSVIHQ